MRHTSSTLPPRLGCDPRELGFDLTADREAEIVRGMGLVQLENGPFDLDLAFAPDGIERFEDAFARHVEVKGSPVCHIDDIIATREATGRVRDGETPSGLKAFRDEWLAPHGWAAPARLDARRRPGIALGHEDHGHQGVRGVDRAP